MTIKKKPELVCPAGDWRSLLTAVDSGADSIYFGVKGLNMRARADNFDVMELNKIMDYLHKHNKKGYLALNVIVMDHQTEKMESILLKAKEAKVDAVILWDMAVLSKAKQLGLNIHLSTQASVSNSRALGFFTGLGVRRAVLARECTLKDITTIVSSIDSGNVPCQIEAFVHGAMC
ncbi:MAG: U32 family peptidase, partial [bacterium]|nr:U32 family peptidase [bacterium]